MSIPVALHGVVALVLRVAVLHAGLLVHVVDALVEVAGILVTQGGAVTVIYAGNTGGGGGEHGHAASGQKGEDDRHIF